MPSPHDRDLEAIGAAQVALIAELRVANVALRAQVGELEAANAKLAGANAALQARVAELERRLGRDSSNSSKPPSSDGVRTPARAQQ